MTRFRFWRRFGSASGMRISGVVAVVVAAGMSAWMLGIASAGKHGTAVPASTVTFGSGNFQAKFVRSASGIVNETSRVNLKGGDQNTWSPYDVWIQFRPEHSTPNPACDETGLVIDYAHNWSTSDSALLEYFPADTTYNVCVYLVTQEITSGTVASNDPSGTSVDLPVTGNYRIQVSGTWQNGSWWLVDAEYVQQYGDGTVGTGGDNNGGTYSLGWYQGWPGLGANFGDLMVNGGFVDWGAYTPSHTYSTEKSLAAGSATLQMGVNDGPGPLSWYSDNSGSLNYTITYLQP